MTIYNTSGTLYTGNPHAVIGKSAGGDTVVTLTGSAVFSSSASYVVTTDDPDLLSPGINITYTSGSQFTITGGGSNTVSWTAIGN